MSYTDITNNNVDTDPNNCTNSSFSTKDKFELSFPPPLPFRRELHRQCKQVNVESALQTQTTPFHVSSHKMGHEKHAESHEEKEEIVWYLLLAE